MSLLRAKEEGSGERERAADEEAHSEDRCNRERAHRGLAFTVLKGTTAPESAELLIAVRPVRGAGEQDRWVSDEVIEVIAEFLIEVMGAQREPTGEE